VMNDIETTYCRLEETYVEITKRYLKINESSIETALYQHTGVFAFFGAVLAYAKRELDRATSSYEYEEASVREARRAELVESGKKATDRSLDAYVKTVSTLRAKEKEVEEASHSYHLAKNIVGSLDHQKDMLVQISANRRAEVKMVGSSEL
jgi:hypothetical protein